MKKVGFEIRYYIRANIIQISISQIASIKRKRFAQINEKKKEKNNEKNNENKKKRKKKKEKKKRKNEKKKKRQRSIYKISI